MFLLHKTFKEHLVKENNDHIQKIVEGKTQTKHMTSVELNL